MKSLKNTVNRWKYASCLVFIPISIIAFYTGGWLGFFLPFFVFGIIPALELFLPASTTNMSDEEEKEALSDPLYDKLLYAVVPGQYLILLAFLIAFSTVEMNAIHAIGAIWTMGITCGVYGINVAHELGHRKKPHEQRMSQALLLSTLYMHFFIEHNRGHHSNVATENDPATSRYGENLYTFWVRSVVYSWLSAWNIENTRLSRKRKGETSLLPVWLSPQNQMLQFQLIQVAFVTGIYAVFGLVPMLAFIAASVIGFLLLETVNYIEHYGLMRQQKDNGRFESVLPIHSWNSDHGLGRLFLFELSRHSDHHAHAARKYQVLRHFDESPQLPTGYPGMMVLSMVPPLYFKVMDRTFDKYRDEWARIREEEAAHIAKVA